LLSPYYPFSPPSAGGYPPFHDENQKALFRKIRKAEYEFHPNYWTHVSPEAKDLISGMLTKVSKQF
jgi:hypothetical protein